MKSAEKITEEIVILRYYNVIFYLFFKPEGDDDRVCKRRGNGISDTDIYSACLACTCVDGKRIHPDGKELQKGRYEPGSGVRICGISKRTSGTL